MKKVLAVLLTAGMVLSLAACGSSGPSLKEDLQLPEQEAAAPAEPQTEPQALAEETEPPTEPAPSKEQVPQREEPPEEADPLFVRLEGFYATEPVEGERTQVEVRRYGDLLVLDVGIRMESEIYSFYATEFWPTHTEELDSRDKQEISGFAQSFSIMTSRPYYEKPVPMTLRLEGENLIIEGGEEGGKTYAPEPEPATLYMSAQEMLTYLFGTHNQDKETVPPTGTWYSVQDLQTTWLQLLEDGTFHLAHKKAGENVDILWGVWLLDQDFGHINCLAQQVGKGGTPLEFQIQWELRGEKELRLSEPAFGMTPMPGNNPVIFCPAPQDWKLGAMGDKLFGKVWELYSLEGSYSDRDGYTQNYSLHLPQLVPDNPEAEAINLEIQNTFVTLVEAQLESMDHQNVMDFSQLHWGCSVHGDLMSLWVCMEDLVGFTLDYACCYDLDREVRVSRAELLEQLGISPEEFVEKTRECARACYEARYADLPAEHKEAGGYDYFLEWTLSQENIHPDMTMYLNPAGELAVVVPIGSMAGAGYDNTVLYPFGES